MFAYFVKLDTCLPIFLIVQFDKIGQIPSENRPLKYQIGFATAWTIISLNNPIMLKFEENKYSKWGQI